MHYYRIPPPARLAGLVQYCWSGSLTPANGEELRHLSVAKSAARIIFHYEGRFGKEMPGGGWEPSFVAGFQGQTMEHAQFVSAEKSGIFGIELEPGALTALFGIPAPELTGRFEELGSVLGKKGAQWQARMLAAADNTERAVLAEAFLSSFIRKKDDVVITSAVRSLGQPGKEAGIEKLAERFHTSRRQFERLFKSAVGLSPGMYSRIRRFELAIGKMPGNDRLTDVALGAGYYDQAHFIRDFHELAGMAPGQYRKAISGLPFPEE